MLGNLGLRLENLREKRGLTKIDLSLRLGFSANVYGSYEREERRPSLETMVKLADIFNVSLDYLIRGEEFQNPNNFLDEAEFQKIKQLFDIKQIQYPSFLQYKKWAILNAKDIVEINNHFEWIVEKAKNR